MITIVRAPAGAPASSGAGRVEASRPLSTAMGGVAGRPARSGAQRAATRAGRYASARTVPAPTRITPASARSRPKISWSAGPPRPPERPSTEAAPSALSIMLARTQGRPASACAG